MTILTTTTTIVVTTPIIPTATEITAPMTILTTTTTIVDTTPIIPTATEITPIVTTTPTVDTTLTVTTHIAHIQTMIHTIMMKIMITQISTTQPVEPVLMIPLLLMHTAMTVSGTLVTQTPVALTMIVISLLQRPVVLVVEMAQALPLPQDPVLIPMPLMMMAMVVTTILCIQMSAVSMIAATLLPLMNAALVLLLPLGVLSLNMIGTLLISKHQFMILT